MEVSIGNTFAMTTHGSFGAFWLSSATFVVPSLNIRGATVCLKKFYFIAYTCSIPDDVHNSQGVGAHHLQSGSRPLNLIGPKKDV
jgi:hypothetical protein